MNDLPAIRARIAEAFAAVRENARASGEWVVCSWADDDEERDRIWANFNAQWERATDEAATSVCDELEAARARITALEARCSVRSIEDTLCELAWQGAWEPFAETNVRPLAQHTATVLARVLLAADGTEAPSD